jgi:hypothetical protein
VSKKQTRELRRLLVLRETLALALAIALKRM